MSIHRLIVAALLISLGVGCIEQGAEAKSQEPLFRKNSTPLLDLPNARTPFDNVLTGGPPTVEQLQHAKAIGFSTIIDLRGTEEKATREANEAEDARRIGLRYFAIPVIGPQDVTVANATTLAAYLADRKNLPAIIHCASGNRVGALLAIKASHIDGLDIESAVQVGKSAGLSTLEAAVRQRLQE